MIALRLTYNGNVDWVYPFPLSFLPSCHSLGGVTGRLARARHGPDRLHASCLRQDRLEESGHVGRSARAVDPTLMLHHVILWQPRAAEDGRFELLRGCLQHAFQLCRAGFAAGHDGL